MGKNKRNREKTVKRLFALEPLSRENSARDEVVIILSSDSKYEPHLWVTLTTMVEEADKNRHYHLYILDGGIRRREFIEEVLEEHENFEIDFIDMTLQFDDFFESRSISKAAYYRLAIFFLFENFDKVVYIDTDSYIFADISELFDVEMEDKQIAGVRDSINYEIPWREKGIRYARYSGKAVNYFTDFLKLTPTRLSKYFSSGVLVFNMQNIDLENKKSQLSELLLEDYYCHDQDILNILFDETQIFLLGREWNYFNSGPCLQEEDFLIEEERDNYLQDVVAPKVVSYVIKPWLKENQGKPYVREYWETLERSPYYNEVKKKMQWNTKLRRFSRLPIKEKFRYLFSGEVIKKCWKGIINLISNKS